LAKLQGASQATPLQLIPDRNKTTAERRYEKASGTSVLQVNQGD